MKLTLPQHPKAREKFIKRLRKTPRLAGIVCRPEFSA